MLNPAQSRSYKTADLHFLLSRHTPRPASAYFIITITMTVPSGNYFIKNLASGYYVASQGHSKDGAGSSISTARPSMIVESSRAIVSGFPYNTVHSFEKLFYLKQIQSFNLTEGDGGLFLIKANWSGAKVGVSVCDTSHSLVIFSCYHLTPFAIE